MIASRPTLLTLMYIITLATAEYNQWLTDDFIDYINSKQNLWKAGHNFPRQTPMKYFKKLMGVLADNHFEKLPRVKHDSTLIAILPVNFDSRNKWPFCPTLNEISDQGSCSSCWALSAVGTMTDRYCIDSNGTQHFHFSAQDLLSCCKNCGDGCYGGEPSYAWEFWLQYGLVSGGSYNSSQGCSPYKIPPCKHGVTEDRAPCSEDETQTPQCYISCENNYSVDYSQDKRYGRSMYTLPPDEDEIKAEIFKNGSVQASFTVYQDFPYYKYGVYKYTKGREIGVHAVKILGWGMERGEKYWLAANTWNSDWGNNGFFKILRGQNHCNIESQIIAGKPIIYN